MAAVDFRGFRKVHADDKVSTFKNDHGHEIRIAHSGLSKKLMKELESLPVYAKDGGGVGDLVKDRAKNPEPKPAPSASNDEATKDADVMFNDPAAGQPSAAIAGAEEPEIQAPPSEPSTWSEPFARSEKKTLEQPSAPTPAPAKPTFNPDDPTHIAHELYAFQHDLMTQKIKPKTMDDLFADKNLGGKIGTILGLIVGGAGAGLAHTDNALLTTMRNEIKNDLDAQVKNRETGINLFNAALTHELVMRGQLPEAEARAMFYKGQAANLPYMQKKLEAEIAEINARTDLMPAQKAAEIAKAKAENAKALNSVYENSSIKMKMRQVLRQQEMREKLRPGILQDAYDRAIQLLQQDLNQDILNTASGRPAKNAAIDTAHGVVPTATAVPGAAPAAAPSTGAGTAAPMETPVPAAPSGAGTPPAGVPTKLPSQTKTKTKEATLKRPVDTAESFADIAKKEREASFNDKGFDTERVQNDLLLKRFGDEMKFPTEGLSEAQYHEIMKEAQTYLTAREATRRYKDSFGRLNQAPLGGRLQPGLREAEMNSLVTFLTQQLAHRYSLGEAKALAEGIFPEWSDVGDTRRRKYQKGIETFHSLVEGLTHIKPYQEQWPYSADIRDLNMVTVHSPKGENQQMPMWRAFEIQRKNPGFKILWPESKSKGKK